MDDHICGHPEQQSLFSSAPNVSEPERFISAIAGGFFLALGLSGTSSQQRLAAMFLGGGLVYRGVSGHCMMYHLLGKSKRKEAKRVEAQIDETVEDSFPASDPPAYTASAASRSQH